jgi:hypothetical protein
MHHANLAYIDMSKGYNAKKCGYSLLVMDHLEINNLNITYQTRSHHLLDLFSTNRDGIQ